MKKILTIIAAFLSFCIISPAETFQKDEELTAFNAIEISNSFQVTLKHGSSYYVQLELDTRIADFYSVYMSGGTLILGINEKEYAKDLVKNVFKQKDVSPLVLRATIYIPRNAEISGIKLKNSATLTADFPLESKYDIAVETTETSTLKGIQMKAPCITLSASKKSTIIAKTDSPTVSVKAKNSSNLDLDVRASFLNVESENYSSLNFIGTASDEVRIKASGFSESTFKTNSEKIFVAAKGNAKINACEASVKTADIELSSAYCKIKPSDSLIITLTSNAKLVFDGTPVFTIRKAINSTIIPVSEEQR